MKKRLFFFTLVALAAFTAQAQILPDWTRARAIGGSQGVQVQSVIMDNAGDIYVSATAFKGPLTIDGEPFSSDTLPNVFVAKFNSAGNFLWKVSVLKNDSMFMGSPFIESIFLDEHNNLYLAVGANGQGGSNDSLHLLLNCTDQIKHIAMVGRGYMELPMRAIIKLDATGKFKYMASIEGFGMGMGKKGEGYSLSINQSLVDNQENLYMAGSFRLDSLRLGSSFIHSSSMEQNTFITKVDTAGHYVWSTIDSASFPSSNGSEAVSIVLDNSGNPLVYGNFSTNDRKFGNFSVNLQANAVSNLFVVSLDNNDGHPLALNTTGGDLQDIAVSMSKDINGNIYITGFTNSSDLFGQPTLGTQNYSTFIANIDADFSLQWAKVVNTELSYYSSNNSLKLLFGPDASPVLAGFFQAKSLLSDSYSVENHDSAAVPNSNDFFLLKIDRLSHNTSYLNSFGTVTYDYDFNAFADDHNITTIIAPIIDTAFFIGDDTLRFMPPASGFIIAHFDSAGNYLGARSFTPETGQYFYNESSDVVQSYSGYIGVAGAFSGSNLNLGSNLLIAQDTISSNMFIAKMGYTMSGNIYDESNQKVGNGFAKLFVLSKSGPAMMVDSVSLNTQGSSYIFRDAPLNNALVFAVADTNAFPGYEGTYSGNSMVWTGATILDLVSTLPSGFNINLKKVAPMNGQGSIEGDIILTYQMAERKILKVAGRPMKGASVVLIGKSTKSADSIMAITVTDDQGHYEFTKVPVGNYVVWIDVAGLGMMEHYEVAVTDLAPAVDDINYIVSENGIYKNISQGIKTRVKENNMLRIYPNPAAGFVHLSIPTGWNGNTTIELYSISGAHLSTLQIGSGINDNVILNTENLPAGIYFVKAAVPGKPPLYGRFLKQ